MNKTLSIFVLLAAIAFAGSPLVFTGFAGYAPDQFPVPQVDPPVQPAGWAFAIWGLIYAWLIAGAAYGVWRAAGDPDWQPMRPWLLASLAVGFFWIGIANRSPIWATVVILAMLGLAVMAFLRAGGSDRLWQIRPVALYAGWLTAASGASLGLVLGGYGVMSETGAALLSLLTVTALALAIHSRRPREWAYPAGVIWALAGIVAANLSPPNWPVLFLALLGMVLLASRAILGVTRS